MSAEYDHDVIAVLRRLGRPNVVLAMAGADYALFQGADRRRRLRTLSSALVTRLMALGHVHRVGAIWRLSDAGQTALAYAAKGMQRPTAQRWVMNTEGAAVGVTVMLDHDALGVLARRYARRGRALTARALMAGERLSADAVLAGFHGGLTACNWGRVSVDGGGHGGDVPERRLDARRRVMMALKGLDGAARGAVVAVCVSQQSLTSAADRLGLEKDAFRIALTRGLDGIADAYGV
jgi:hypothetical protein